MHDPNSSYRPPKLAPKVSYQKSRNLGLSTLYIRTTGDLLERFYSFVLRLRRALEHPPLLRPLPLVSGPLSHCPTCQRMMMTPSHPTCTSYPKHDELSHQLQGGNTQVNTHHIHARTPTPTPTHAHTHTRTHTHTHHTQCCYHVHKFSLSTVAGPDVNRASNILLPTPP